MREMKKFDVIPSWLWSTIWFSFGAVLLAAFAFVPWPTENVSDFGPVLLIPGISAVGVGLAVPLMSVFDDELEPIHQIVTWLGLCMVMSLTHLDVFP